MRILHVISGVGINGGGTSEVVPRICEALQANDIQTSVLTIDWGQEVSHAMARAQMMGVELVKCAPLTMRSPLRSLALSKEFDCRIAEAVANADCVHLHGLWQWPCWRAAAEAQGQGKPYLIQTHGFLEPERLKKSWLRKKIVWHLIEQRKMCRAAAAIATAESEATHLRQHGIRRPIKVVPIGLDVGEIDAVQCDADFLCQYGVPQGKRVLLYLSRLAPIKGLDMLAEAWSHLSEFHSKWQLVIAGPGDRGYEKVVQDDFAGKVQDGSVTFTGAIYGAPKLTLLKSAAAFVLPTRSENWSIAVAEALAAGLPTVCTKGAPWECLNAEKAGWWVDVSVEAIERGLRQVMSLSDDERRLMGLRGHDWVVRNLAWDRIARGMIEVYREVLKH